MEINKINIGEKLQQFSDYWNPRIVGELNGQYVKLVKVQGEFIWHQHKDEDELFMLITGNFSIELRDKTIQLKPGEMVIIPKGVEHKPIAEGEAHILLFEPKEVLNTGNIQNERTRTQLEKI